MQILKKTAIIIVAKFLVSPTQLIIIVTITMFTDTHREKYLLIYYRFLKYNDQNTKYIYIVINYFRNHRLKMLRKIPSLLQSKIILV